MDTWRQDQIEIARRNNAMGIPDSRWCGDPDCDLNGMEHRHFLSTRQHPVPVDLSWVTTEPVYEGPKWLHAVKLVAGIGLMCMLGAIAIAVVVKA